MIADLTWQAKERGFALVTDGTAMISAGSDVAETNSGTYIASFAAALSGIWRVSAMFRELVAARWVVGRE